MLLHTLSDHWQIRPLDAFRQGIYPRGDEGWLPARVPAHWQQLPGLERHAGRVVYRCRFALEEPRTENQEPTTSYAAGGSQFSVLGSPVLGSRYWLRLNGVFYRSRPYLNGIDLGPHEGYFIPNEQEVSGLLQRENSLLLEVDCPDERDKLGKRMITGVFSHWDCFDPQANPGGIWLPVELHGSGPVRLRHCRLLTVACDERLAQVRFDLDLDAADDCTVTVRLRFTPRNVAGEPQQFEQQRLLRRGPQELGGLIKLREPRLWWTHDLGRPDLYDVSVELLLGDALSDATTVIYGARSFELRDWIPFLNGVRFLAKGNNYPPGDMRIATMTRARYDHDLQLARDCHMNMLRVHAHVDHPALYAAADEAGILLWQDFPLQWIYDRSILAEARRQARQMARLLGGHPSVGVWCMHNEPVVIEDTADESLLSRLRTFRVAFGFGWNRDVLDTQLKQVIEQEDPTRPAVRSSGEIDIPYVRKGTDAHAYFGWYRNYGTLDDAETMRQRFPANLAFVTEFGAQSFPNLESSLRFMPDPLTEAAIEQLVARHCLQADIMSNWIPWREAGSLAEVIDLSQDYQIFINRYYIDRLRFHKYRPTGGIVPFLFVDAHPAITWSVIDYWRVPKRSYYALQLALSPQYAFCLYAPRSYSVGEAVELPLYAVNDAQRAYSQAILEARLSDPSGALLAESRHRLELPADCLPILVDRLRLTLTQAGRYALTLSLSGVEHELRQVYEIEARA
jgi:beta-mannosidase